MSQSRSDCKKTELCYCTFLADGCCLISLQCLGVPKETAHLHNAPGRERGHSAQYAEVARFELRRDALREGLLSEI